jgi:hypothetical protein
MTTLGPFRFYTARRDYLEALRSYRPGMGVPVLGAPGQAHEPRRSRVRRIAGALAVSIDAATAELDDREISGPRAPAPTMSSWSGSPTRSANVG